MVDDWIIEMAQYGGFTIDEVETLMMEEDEVMWGREGLFRFDDEYFEIVKKTCEGWVGSM